MSDSVEEVIAAAAARGEFDDLPGSGEALQLNDDGPGWWARRKMDEIRRQERLEGLAAEIERSQDRLWSLPHEEAVRTEVERINRQVDLINEKLAGVDRLDHVRLDAALSTWRRMFRVRQR